MSATLWGKRGTTAAGAVTAVTCKVKAHQHLTYRKLPSNGHHCRDMRPQHHRPGGQQSVWPEPVGEHMSWPSCCPSAWPLLLWLHMWARFLPCHPLEHCPHCCWSTEAPSSSPTVLVTHRPRRSRGTVLVTPRAHPLPLSGCHPLALLQENTVSADLHVTGSLLASLSSPQRG